ncbi:hypothetical protein BKA70DRAFT_1370411 [Coprinopsis sp. MPI-PUGE-AT-0042]|nr:hypothetical protein BKA70DRAFT_1370411 [Coprinopsis sp. MPI-PUGE-AT-0042]
MAHVVIVTQNTSDPNCPPPIPSPFVSLELEVECDQIAAVCLSAIRARLSVPWKIEDYMAKAGKRQAGNAEREKELSSTFPGIFELDPGGKSKVVDVPLSVADAKGRYLLWYLPSIVSQTRQEKIYNAIEWLSIVKPEVNPLQTDADGNFRTHSGLFYEGKYNLRSGVATYASAWPMQGHPDGPLTPSSSFRDSRQGGLHFTALLSESLAIIGAILAVIHPALFEAGLDAIAELYSGNIDVGQPALLRKVLEVWGVAIHPPPVSSYDILYTGGSYTDGRIEVHGVGLRCRYNPGTVVATLGAVFPHGVGPVNGERFCLAHFFREAALDKAQFFRIPSLPSFDNLSRIYFFKDRSKE